MRMSEIDLKQFKLLIVEDAESIRLAIRDYLISYFQVKDVGSAEAAEEEFDRAIEEGKPYHLLIADIHLPNRSGLDLVKFCREKDSEVKIVLITSYDINDYIEFIQQEGIEQVISNHSQLSLHDLYVVAYKSLTNDIFGADRYFKSLKIYYPQEIKNSLEPKNRELYSIRIKSSEDRTFWTDKISLILKNHRQVPESFTKLILDEITTNAMVRAPQHEDGTYKYQTRVVENDILIPSDNIQLDPEDYFLVQYGFYDDWVIITCQDPHGHLNKKEILYRLKRHISRSTQSGLPDGLADSHGRGIFLMREHLTHLIFNVQRGRKTEVLCFYNIRPDIPYKNISIYELN